MPERGAAQVVSRDALRPAVRSSNRKTIACSSMTLLGCSLLLIGHQVDARDALDVIGVTCAPLAVAWSVISLVRGNRSLSAVLATFAAFAYLTTAVLTLW